MESVFDGEFSTVQVNVRFIRRYGFYLLTLYIPTTLLMVIAYATFFFSIDDFNSRIVVALTALLVLASLFTQVLISLAFPPNGPQNTELISHIKYPKINARILTREKIHFKNCSFIYVTISSFIMFNKVVSVDAFHT